MNTKIKLVIPDQEELLTVCFNDELECWKISTPQNKKLNKFLGAHCFNKISDILNYFKLNKVKFDKNYFKKFKQPKLKSFDFNTSVKFKDRGLIVGLDVSQLFNTTVVCLKFKGKLSYFYTTECSMSYYGFGSSWKTQNEYDDSAIWNAIRYADSLKWICFNDIYEKFELKYEKMIDNIYDIHDQKCLDVIENLKKNNPDYDPKSEPETPDPEIPYESIVDYAKACCSHDRYLIIKFCHLFKKIIDNEENEESPLRSQNPQFTLKCLTDFYQYEKDFYKDEFKISQKTWNFFERKIGKSKSIILRKNDILLNVLNEKSVPQSSVIKTKI